jgi:TonB family protein
MGWMWHWKMEPMPDAELPSMEIEMVRTIGDGMVVKPQPVLPGPIPRRDIVEKPKLRDLPKPWAKRERPSEKGGAMPVPVPLSPNAPVEPSAPAQTPSPPLPIAETAAAPPMVVTVDTPGFPYGYYLRLIQKKVEERWRFPVSGGERSALIAFTIRSGGRVAGIFVESGSGDSYFDQTAIRAVAACDPFPPLPRGYPEGELRVHYRFQFHDRG